MVFPFLYMLNLNVHAKAFGYEMHLVPEPFDQDTSVALDLIKPLVMSV
jgi:hypothetical protein